MGVVGSWGARVFSVGGDKVLTFKDYTRRVAYRVETNEDGSGKPGTARIAPELQTITFIIQLSLSLGVAPNVEEWEWRAACEAGQTNPLYIGGVAASENHFIIQSITQSEAVFGARGELLSCSLNVTLMEYKREVARKQDIQPVVSTSTTSKKKNTSSSSKPPSSTEGKTGGNKTGDSILDAQPKTYTTTTKTGGTYKEKPRKI